MVPMHDVLSHLSNILTLLLIVSYLGAALAKQNIVLLKTLVLAFSLTEMVIATILGDTVTQMWTVGVCIAAIVSLSIHKNKS